MDPFTRLTAGKHRIICGYGERILDFGLHALGLCRWEVDLVYERDDLEVRVHGKHGVGHRLGFDALGGIDHQHGTFARCKAARYLVGEVDMTGSVYEVELVYLAIIGCVFDTDGLALDRDATFALDVHGVEHLLLHVTAGNGARHLQDAVGQRRLSMVDVRYDAEVAYVFRICTHSRYFNANATVSKVVVLTIIIIANMMQ